MKGKGNNRAPWHDYRSRARYMVTLKKLVEAPIFGNVTGPENPFTLLTRAGTEVKNALGNLRMICSDIRIWQYVVMPDHVHFLINVENNLDEPLGNYIARLKIDINSRCGQPIFEDGFNDQIITPQRSLDAVFQYIRQNPYRLAIRFAHPEYFRRINRIELAGCECQAYGNLQLLQNPFKSQVVCHRADSDSVKRANMDQWMYTALNGGVLVSPFISRTEKEVRTEAEKADGKIILINNMPLGEREKPAAHDFKQCEEGRLLIITPLGLRPNLDRETCLVMNSFASKLALITN